MPPNIPKLLDELEERIEKLKMEYDRYFLGLERFEPVKQRREVERLVRYLRSQVISNTALKFRFHMLIQRLTTYKQYWDRVQRQIEEGTYRRDLLRIQRKLQRQGIQTPNLARARTALDVEAALAQALRQGAQRPETEPQTEEPAAQPGGAGLPPVAGEASRRRTPPPIPKEAGRPGGIPEQRLRKVYEAYLDARRKTGQPTEGLTFDRFVQSVAKALPKLQKAAGVKEVEFAVEVKDGKAHLKAIPKG